MADGIEARLERNVMQIAVPGARGAMTNGDLEALTGALDGAGQASCAAVVLRSGGEDFCRGRSLPPEAERPGADGPWGIENRNAAPVLRTFAALGRVQVPVIAVVTGRAWGLGCALAAAADVTFASAGATFCLPEMQHGIPPTLALSVLRDIIPYKALLDFVLTSRVVSAADAVGLGLVTAVIGGDAAGDPVERLLARLRTAERVSLVTVKRYLRTTARMDTQGAVEFASMALAGALSSVTPGSA